MGQQPHQFVTMNSNSSARSPGYHQKAMEEIQNSLRPFAKSGGDPIGSSAASTISITSATSGVSSLGSAASSTSSNLNDKDLLLIRQLINMGYSEVSVFHSLFMKCLLLFRSSY